jgi:hypothetical protein
VCVVEDKRLRREEFWGVVVGSCCCVCFFGEENLEIKYAIVFHCDCSILSVYMLEGE